MSPPPSPSTEPVPSEVHSLLQIMQKMKTIGGSGSSETMEIPDHFTTKHGRSQSICQFEEDIGLTAAVTMKTELDRLVAISKEECSSAEEHDRFAHEMGAFFRLFLRYLKSQSEDPIDWEKVQEPGADLVIPYSKLESESQGRINRECLNRLAVVKLNGGLGTTMGCVGPKSAIEVRDGMSFLDLSVRQIECLNSENGASVQLLLMDSFNTEAETVRILRKYQNRNVRISSFRQSRFPRIKKDSWLPVPQHPHGSKTGWYPPGHGDVYDALNQDGLLDSLIAQGIDFLFISNVDNLGATVDPLILDHIIRSGAEFVMEVTDKTKADIKGGTIVNYNGQVRLLEIAQVPPEHKADFTAIKKFRIFNTNNIWVSTRAIKRLLDQAASPSMDLDLIINHKIVEDTGVKVIQLETAIGAAIKHFSGAHGVNVPRSRFLPVKSCSDLFLVQSDLYTLQHGSLVLNSKRTFGNAPLVKLGDNFKKVAQYLSRFASPPRILELDHLTVIGDVYFGKNVTLKGTVIIVANNGERIDIPSGSILEDKVVSGNLRIVDH